jgi:hypothetical protein
MDGRSDSDIPAFSSMPQYDAVYANLLSAIEILVCVNTFEHLLKILM